MHSILSRWNTLFFASALTLLLAGCKAPAKPTPDKLKLHIVATTTMIADTADEIGQDAVRVSTLVGPGIDVHSYRLTDDDKKLLSDADLILYNGLGLEDNIMPELEKLEKSGKKVVAVSKDITKDKLISINGSDKDFDPHIWMDCALWMTPAKTIADAIIAEKPEKEAAVRTSEDIFIGKLRMLEANIRIALVNIPEKDRHLVTTHEAFAYWARAYNFQVKSLLWVDPANTASTTPIDSLVDYIVENKIPAIFPEASTSQNQMDALQKAVEAKGHKVRLSRPIYSDSFGNYGTMMASYIGMLRFDAGIIAQELTPPTPE